MRIAIAERFRPYSHCPGTFVLVPGTTVRLQVFPSMISVCGMSGPLPHRNFSIQLPFLGPVKEFTVQQDLEKGVVRAWGHARQGFFRYACSRADSLPGIAFFIEKWPDMLPCPFPKAEGTAILWDKEVERLSLGSHKAQDWEMVSRRGAMEEIMPLWFRLGQMLPEIESSREGVLELLDSLCSAISSNSPETILPSFTPLFLAGFNGLLSPSLNDDFHQGLCLKEVGHECRASPLAILTEGAKLIRSLFIREEKHGLAMLPRLPPEFHCGRMTGVKSSFGELDFEWSKKLLRRVVLRPAKNCKVDFNFQKSLKSFRFREGNKDKGARLLTDQSLEFQAGKLYYLDNFQK